MADGLGAVACLLACFALASFWRRRDWGDAPGAKDMDRKQQGSPVPAVGGLAIAFGWAVSLAVGGWEELPGVRGAGWNVGLALAFALLSGALDDFKAEGLSPRAKLLCQAITGLILASYSPSLSSCALWILLSMVAQNSLNTFDNADGASASLTAVGLLLCMSPLAPAVAVFLLPNLLRRSETRKAGQKGEPWAYLGDAGSQMLGIAVLVTPGAWPVLVLPLVDLLHVALRRALLRLAPWDGDRRHLAHRLQRAGLGPKAVVGVLLLLSAPVFLRPDSIGLGVTLALYSLLCLGTRRLAEPDSVPISTI